MTLNQAKLILAKTREMGQETKIPASRNTMKISKSHQTLQNFNSDLYVVQKTDPEDFKKFSRNYMRELDQ